MEYAIPQVRDVSADAVQKLHRSLSGRTEALEGLGLEMFARGCSTRDIEAIFRDDEGNSLLSRSAVSAVTEALWQEYEEFATRDLSEIEPLYLFIDGVAERLRPGAKREAVLCAWAISWQGRKALIGLAPGTKESTEACTEFLQELTRRGLGAPVLVATDGAPGLIHAVEKVFPKSLRQRCLAHKMRNLLNKLPEDIKAEFKEAARAAYQAPSPAMARTLRDDLVDRFGRDYPSAVICFKEDFEACIAHLHCPPTHRRVIRTTNLLERLFVEERRRVKAAGHLFGEQAVLKLMYGALIRASDNWKGISISDLERRQLQQVQAQISDIISQQKEESAPKKRAPSLSRIYSNKKT